MITPLPTLFLSHGGGPAFFMDPKTSGPFAEMGKGSEACRFYANLGRMIPDEQIRAILIISAHWEETEFTVTYHDGPQPPPLTYDYYGFPTDMYAPHMVYPARTDLKVADRVIELLANAGIPCRKDRKRGFDHGVFIPLKASFEDARFPVVQLSLKSGLDVATHLQMGEALSALRSEGVLIIGSGSATHNLSEIDRSGSPATPAPWAAEFLEWLRHTMVETSGVSHTTAQQSLLNIMQEAPHAQRAHPRIEHLLPLHVAFAAATPRSGLGEDVGIKGERLFHQLLLGTLSLDSYSFQ